MIKRLNIIMYAFPAFGLLILLFVSLRTPSLNSTWDEDVEVLAGIEVSATDLEIGRASCR